MIVSASVLSDVSKSNQLAFRVSISQKVHQLFTKRRKALLALAYQRCRSYSDAEDFVQECFARALKIHWDDVEKPDAMLATILLNVIRDSSRRSRQSAVVFMADHFDSVKISPDLAPSPEQHLVHKEALSQAFDAISNLPLKRQQIFRMRRIQGMSRRAIANATGMTIGAIEKHIERGLQDIRLAVEKKAKSSKRALKDSET